MNEARLLLSAAHRLLADARLHVRGVADICDGEVKEEADALVKQIIDLQMKVRLLREKAEEQMNMRGEMKE